MAKKNKNQSKQLSYPYKTKKQLLREMQLLYKKTQIQNQCNQNQYPQENQRVTISTKDKEIRISFSNVLLPYTKYEDNIIIPQNFRIRFDYQEIQLLKKEAKLKMELLQTYQRIQRKDYKVHLPYISVPFQYKIKENTKLKNKLILQQQSNQFTIGKLNFRKSNQILKQKNEKLNQLKDKNVESNSQLLLSRRLEYNKHIILKKECKMYSDVGSLSQKQSFLDSLSKIGNKRICRV